MHSKQLKKKKNIKLFKVLKKDIVLTRLVVVNPYIYIHTYMYMDIKINKWMLVYVCVGAAKEFLLEANLLSISYRNCDNYQFN